MWVDILEEETSYLDKDLCFILDVKEFVINPK